MTNITDLPKQSLTITVWHHDKENQPEYIGQYQKIFSLVSRDKLVNIGEFFGSL
jgi:hypothetical protein